MKKKKMDESPNKSKTETKPEEEEEVDGVDQAVDSDVEEEEEEEEETSTETPEQSVARLENELATLRIQLRRANKQAAERRIRLKELGKEKQDGKEQSSEEADAGAGLRNQLQAAQRSLRQYKLIEQLEEALDGLDISFASARARSDALGFAQREIEKEFVEDDDNPEEEDLTNALRKVVKTRPYLVRSKKEPPITDSKKRGKAEGLILDEKDIATRFGIKPM